jgi:serine/threonine protein phosphatase PrpC
MADGGESAAVSFFGVSDVGLVRKSNEDAFGVFGAGGGHLGEAGRVAGGGDLIAVVSDGVGGHDAGEVASAAAVASLGAGLGQLAVGGVAEEAVPGALRGLLDGLNRHLRSFSKNRGQEKRMAATATAAWLGRGRLAVAHVGDSRLYRWRGGQLTCLTVDDTEAARAVAEGRITPEQARTHAKKHVLERAVGMDPQKFASSAEIHAVEDGDVYMLCSDGLTDGLSDQQLERGFEGLDPGDLAAFAERLVEAGNRASGKDNITAVLLAVGPGWVKASRRAAPPPLSASSSSTASGDSIMQAFSRSAWPLWAALILLFAISLFFGGQTREAVRSLDETTGGLGVELNRLHSEQLSLGNAVAGLKVDLEDLGRQLTAIDELSTGQFNTLVDFGGRLGRIEDEVRHASWAANELSNRVSRQADTHREEMRAVRREIAGRQEAIDELFDQVSQIQQSVDRLDSDWAVLEGRFVEELNGASGDLMEVAKANGADAEEFKSESSRPDADGGSATPLERKFPPSHGRPP